MSATRPSFRKSIGGNISIFAALVAVPIVAAAGLAIDSARGYRTATELQELADGAVLFSAGAQDVTGDAAQKAAKRIKFATEYLAGKLPQVSDVEIIGPSTVTADSQSVKVSINGRVRGSLMNVLSSAFKDAEGTNVNIVANSVARFGSDAYSCMLSLNPTAAQTMAFSGNATLLGVNCRVQANSNNAVAMKLQGASSLSAAEICAVGGASGSKYTPVPTHCPAKTDPYASLVMPVAAASCSSAFTNVKVKNVSKNLVPGTYCGGLDVQTGGTANLASGLYIIKDGPLSAASNSIINAPSGVTIYLTGASSKIDIASGAIVTINAPTAATANSTTLLYKSMAIIQDRTTGIGNVNQISSKGGVNITGVYYTPAQALSITANGAMNANSAYFPVIVDTFSAGGTGDLYVRFDYKTAGFDNPIPLMTKGKVSLIQ